MSAAPATAFPSSDTSLPRNPDHAIEVRDVSKRFLINRESVSRWSLFFWNRLASDRKQEALWALQGINLDVKRGEVLGIVGTNGSGKSTLVRLMAGISTPTGGEVRRLPRVATLLDLTAGFHPTLSGYENIFLSGSLMGMSRAQVRERLHSIIEFSGVDRRYLDVPVRFYSSGMTARLGFSLAVSCDPDIILVDEVLAVGDAEFQAKSAKRLLEFRHEGKAMVMVSHQEAALMEFCNRIAWLNNGEILAEGNPSDVIPQYRRFLNERISDQRQLEHTQKAHQRDDAENEDHRATLTTRFVGDDQGRQQRAFRLHDPLHIVLAATAEGAPCQARLHVRVKHDTGVTVDEMFWPPLDQAAMELGLEATEITFRIPRLLLFKGTFPIQFRLEDSATRKPFSAAVVEEITLVSDLREIPNQITDVPVEFVGSVACPPIQIKEPSD